MNTGAWLILIFAILLSDVSITSAELPVPPVGLTDLPAGKTGLTIRYGYELLSRTSEYLGPKGKVGSFTLSRMACGNCHLDVGMRVFGNSFLYAQALYPQYREREGRVQTLADRTNACLEHNLLGKPLPLAGPEMEAILLYYKWLGRGQPSLTKDPDRRLPPLAFLDRAANPAKGRVIFESRCVTCHGADGQGQLRPDRVAYIYPPLWGPESFMQGASLSRLSLLARFIKGNMPYGVTPSTPVLSDEESWDVSAFVLNHARPQWKGRSTFPDLKEKPFDFPIPPYLDPYKPEQHLLGPFQPIVDFWTTQVGARAKDPTTGI